MNISVLNKINMKIQNISQLYYKQVYVHEYKRGNTVEYFSQTNQYPFVNINLLLSEKLISIAYSRRPYKAVEILKEYINNFNSEIVCIDYYEILFEPSLEVNPFEIFTNLSRNKTLVITWRGKIENGYFIHAEPSHPEYIKYSTKDAIVIN